MDAPQFDVWVRGDVTVARLRASGDPAGEPVSLPAVAAGARKLVIDLTAADSVPSALLGQLLITHRRVAATRGQARLCAAGGVLEVLAITRLDRVFQVFPTLDAALDGF